MKLEILHVPDCPNLAPMLERLAEVTDLPVTTRVIDSDADAARFGMAGSPTLLVDGIDPFTTAGDCECGVSCRLYRDEAGRIVPAPSVEQLRDALRQLKAPGEDSPPQHQHAGAAGREVSSATVIPASSARAQGPTRKSGRTGNFRIGVASGIGVQVYRRSMCTLDANTASLDWVPASCTLPTVEQPIRVAEFDDLFTASVQSAERIDPTTLRLTVAGDAEAQARDLAGRESSCCSFFGFDFTPAGDVVEMTVTVPAAHVAVLDAFASRAVTNRWICSDS